MRMSHFLHPALRNQTPHYVRAVVFRRQIYRPFQLLSDQVLSTRLTATLQQVFRGPGFKV